MKDKMQVAVMASGRGSNFKALVEACRQDDFPASIRILVVDNPDAGALETAERMGIESVVVDCGDKRGSMTPESSRQITELLEERGIGLVCLAGFMRIVKHALLDEYAGRMMNIHPALLPSFKGLDGQRQALEYGVRFAGCTVHFVDKGIDTGPIITQRIVYVLQHDDVDSLSARILEQEHKAYPEAVRLFADGKIRIEGRRVFILDDE